MDGYTIHTCEEMKLMENYVKYVLVIAIIVALVVAVSAYILFQGAQNGSEEGSLIDDTGYSLTLTSTPERIVSLAPSNTEILFAVGAGDKVVGVTDYCDYPYNFTAWIQAGNMTSIGNFANPSVEPIVALDPDLVLASSLSQEAADNLRSLGYNVLVLDPGSMDDVFNDILLVGNAVNRSNDAVALESELKQRIDAIADQAAAATSTPKVYHEVYPLMSAGPNTFIDALINLAGGVNIFHEAATSYPTISYETVIEKNPDVMVFPDKYMGREQFSETLEDVINRPGWDSINAVQNGAIYEIDSDVISRGGPRLADALEILAKMIHPEVFGQP
jgi:iron complex transport system substrate-binding protein